MDKYYYLIAQLPFLEFGKKTELSKEDFLQEAKKWLSEKDFSELIKSDIEVLEVKAKNLFLKNYKKFELGLRKELAGQRKKNQDSQSGQAQEFLNKHLLEGNPLEVEKKLLFYRWQKVEEEEIDFAFSLEAVIAYFLKLQILEKVVEFDREKGIKIFDSLTEVDDEKIR